MESHSRMRRGMSGAYCLKRLQWWTWGESEEVTCTGGPMYPAGNMAERRHQASWGCGDNADAGYNQFQTRTFDK